MEAKTVTIQCRVDEGMLATLNRVCELRGQSKAEYIRNATREAIANEKDVYKMLLKQVKRKK